MVNDHIQIVDSNIIRAGIAGMSHVASLSRGWDDIKSQYPNAKISFHDLRKSSTQTAPKSTGLSRAEENLKTFQCSVASYRIGIEGANTVIFSLQGNQHNVVGLVEIDTMEAAIDLLDQRVAGDLNKWLSALLPHSPNQSFILLPPPPIEHLQHLIANRGAPFKQRVSQYGLRNAADRRSLWQYQCNIIRRVAVSREIPVIDLPSSVFSDTGLLHPACCGDELTHGNTEFGRRVMQHLESRLQSLQEE